MTDHQIRDRLNQELSLLIKSNSLPVDAVVNESPKAIPKSFVPDERRQHNEEEKRDDPIFQVPVLVRSVQPGEVITGRDLEWATFDNKSQAARAVGTMEEIIGKTPTRRLNSGREILAHNLTEVPVIEKGQMVSIILRHGGMRITSTGKALDDGAIGDVINIMNSVSKKTVHAMVEGSNRAKVVLPSRLLALSESE